MKLYSGVARFGFLMTAGLLLSSLTSCAAVDDVARVVGSNGDDVVQAMGRNADEIAPQVGNSADEVGTTLKGVVGTVDNPPVTHSNQAPKLVGVEPESNGFMKAFVEEAGGQAVELSVDCVQGLISPAGAIESADEGSFVQSVCAQAVSANSDGSNQPSDNSGSGIIRVVSAGDGYANLRSAPSTEVSTIAQIPNGTSVKLVEQTQNTAGQLWYKVEVNGQTGWVYSGLLD